MKLTSAEMLAARMKQRGISYQMLAGAAGVSKSFISHLTSGRKSTCTPAVASRIEVTLDVPKGFLFVERTSTVDGRSIPRRGKVAA